MNRYEYRIITKYPDTETMFRSVSRRGTTSKYDRGHREDIDDEVNDARRLLHSSKEVVSVTVESIDGDGRGTRITVERI